MFFENKPVPFPGAATVTVGTGAVVDIKQLHDKGFTYVKGSGAAFTAVLEASVSGDLWTEIDDMDASAQGAIAAQYNYVRINCSAQGALGTGTKVRVTGKEQA